MLVWPAMYAFMNTYTHAPSERPLPHAQAIEKVEKVLADSKAQGRASVVFIVGRGLRSHDGVAKLKPAVASLIQRHNLRCTVGL